MKSNIAVIIPTFNQKEATLKTIKLLREQTVIPDIVIVDNNSADNTANEISETHPDIIILKASDNFGSSGGQYIGTRYAYEKGYDWIIMSDNDAYPASANLIEELVKNASDSVVTQPFNKYGSEHNSTILSLHLGCYSRSIVEKIGLPLFDFFIFGDDEEYSRRLKKAGFKINKLEHIFYFHEMKRTFSPSKFYFSRRNFLRTSFCYDKKYIFLFRSLVTLSSLIVYKIMGEKDCYYYGLQGVKHFLGGKYDNSMIQKSSKYFSTLISEELGILKKKNANAFINVSGNTNRFLKMKSLRGRVNNLKNLIKLINSKKMITESIVGYEAIFCSFLFNNSLIAINSIDAEKVEYRKYNFYFYPKKFFLFFVYSMSHFNLFLRIFLKSIWRFKKNNLGDLNKKYDKEKLDFYIEKGSKYLR